MNPNLLRSIIPFLFIALSMSLSGCVSSRYKQIAPTKRSEPVAMRLQAENPRLSVSVDSVIVYKGPGSWKREAYWDEYVITLRNAGGAPVVVKNAFIEDSLGTPQPCGDDPWNLETASRGQLRRYARMGRQVVLGVGLATIFVGSVEVLSLGAWIGEGAATAASATIVAIPVSVAAHLVLSHKAKGAINREFQKRRFALPLSLEVGSSRTGSLFFPVSPGPRRLTLTYTIGGKAEQLVLEIKGLENLHLKGIGKTSEGTPAAAK